MRKVSQSFVLQFKKRWHSKYMLKTFVWRQLLTWITNILHAPYYLVDSNTTILFKICICWTKRGKNINYFQCYDIEWVSTLFLFARWDQRVFFRIKHAYICICEKVPPFIVLITLLIIKGKDLNWLLASCKDTAIKRFFHKQACSKSGRQAGSQPGQTKRTWTLNSLKKRYFISTVFFSLNVSSRVGYFVCFAMVLCILLCKRHNNFFTVACNSAVEWNGK